MSLLTVTNLEAHACGWRGGRAAPQHTSLAAWLPPGAATAAATAAAAAAAAAAGDSSSDDEAPAPADPASDPAAEVVAGSGDSAALQLPPHVYYLAGNRCVPVQGGVSDGSVGHDDRARYVCTCAGQAGRSLSAL